MNTPPDLDTLAMIVTREDFRAAIQAGVSVAHLAEHSGYAKARAAERREVERLAIPYTKARMSVIPYYRDRLDDEPLWRALIWQPVVSTMELYAKLAAEERAAQLAGLPWTPESAVADG